MTDLPRPNTQSETLKQLNIYKRLNLGLIDDMNRLNREILKIKLENKRLINKLQGLGIGIRD